MIQARRDVYFARVPDTFTGADIARAVLAGGCPPPRHGRQWGGVIRALRRAGVIVPTGRFVDAGSYRPSREWRRA